LRSLRSRGFGASARRLPSSPCLAALATLLGPGGGPEPRPPRICGSARTTRSRAVGR